MEEERDVVVFTDDDGNEFELDVIDYFEHEGDEYAVLMELSADGECECGEGEECSCEQDVYIMKVVVNGEYEEFVPPDEDKMEALSEIVEQRLSEDECGCDCGECDCDDDCHDVGEGCKGGCDCHK